MAEARANRALQAALAGALAAGLGAALTLAVDRMVLPRPAGAQQAAGGAPSTASPSAAGGEASGAAAGAPGALAPVGGDHLAQHLPGGRVALYRLTDAGALELAKIYALRRDADRHLLGPDQRAPHGYYLDDLGAAGASHLAALEARFDALAASREADIQASQRLEELARAILAAGDATRLVAALQHPSYTARRAAALVLAEAGFWQALPRLSEVLEEQSGPWRDRAARVLTERAGHPIQTPADLEAWWRTVPAAQRYRTPQ